MIKGKNKSIESSNSFFHFLAYPLLCLGILWLGFYIRVHNLEQFPVQADEATGAYFVAQSFEGNYAYNPHHFHGPTLIYAGNMIARFFGENSWQSLTQKSLRLVPIFSSLGILIILFAHRKALGTGSILITTSLIATSPFLVYYNRIFIHETLLALFSGTSLATLYQFHNTINHRKSVLLGIFIGFSVATKETFVITVFAWLVVGASLGIGKKFVLSRDYPSLLTFSFVFLGSAGFLSTNLGSEWGNFFDFITTYWKYQTTEGHHKPFYYYFTQFALPSINRGLFWWEGLVFWLSLLTCFTKKKENLKGYFFFFSGTLQMIIYSLIPYKVPWLMLVPWLHFTIATGLSLSALGKKYRWSLVIIPFIVILIWHFYQSYRIVSRYHSDTRNPFAYVPSSKTLVKWENSINRDFLHHMHLFSSEQKSYVIGSDYWPLPWYLRKLTNIFFIKSAPKNIQLNEAPMVIGVGSTCDLLTPIMKQTHGLRFQGLRNGVTLRVFIRKDLKSEADFTR